MPLRKLKTEPKRNKGIYEYYRSADVNQVTEAYYYAFTGADGKSKKVKAESMSIIEVRKERANAIAEGKTNREVNADTADMILNDLMADYFVSREKQKNLKKDSQSYNNHVREVLGDKMVSRITTADIKTLRSKLKDKGLSDSTVKNVLIILKAGLNHAIDKGMVTQRAFNKKVDGKSAIDVKKSQNGVMRILSEEEVAELFDRAEKVDNRLLFMLKMLYYTAQRPKSILDLKCNSIDMKGGTITLEEIKGQAPVTMGISKKLVSVLEEWLEGKEPYERLIPIGYDRMVILSQMAFTPLNEKFFMRRGMKRGGDAYKEARRLAYKENQTKWASMYSLRHAAATRILSNTGNIKLAKEILRHSDLKMTEIYAKISDTQKQEALDAI